MKKIESIAQEEETRLVEHRERWLKIGRSTKQDDRSEMFWTSNKGEIGKGRAKMSAETSKHIRSVTACLHCGEMGHKIMTYQGKPVFICAKMSDNKIKFFNLKVTK